MKKGEKALLEIDAEYAYGSSGSPPNIPPNAKLQFEVTLLDFQDKEKDKWSMTTEERVESAKILKEEGNKHFRSKAYNEAIIAYEKAQDFLDVNTDEKVEANKQLKIVNLNNLAQCHLYLGSDQQAIDTCNKVLKIESTNPKALYRRAVAYINQQKLEQARTDLNKVLEKDPQNQDVKNYLKIIKAKYQEIDKKEKKVWGNLFSQTYYEDNNQLSYPDNPKVYFDIKYGANPAERIEFELY